MLKATGVVRTRLDSGKDFVLLQTFGWIFFALLAVVLIGVGVGLELRRRKRAAAERRAVWKAHQEWLRNSAPRPPRRDQAQRDQKPRAPDTQRVANHR